MPQLTGRPPAGPLADRMRSMMIDPREEELQRLRAMLQAREASQEQLPRWNPTLSALPPNVERTTETSGMRLNPGAASYRAPPTPAPSPMYGRRGSALLGNPMELMGHTMTQGSFTKPPYQVPEDSTITTRDTASLPYAMGPGDAERQAELELMGPHFLGGGTAEQFRGTQNALSRLFNQGGAGQAPGDPGLAALLARRSDQRKADRAFSSSPMGMAQNLDLQGITDPRDRIDMIIGQYPHAVDKLEALQRPEVQNLFKSTPKGMTMLTEAISNLILGGKVEPGLLQGSGTASLRRMSNSRQVSDKKTAQIVRDFKGGKITAREARNQIQRLQRDSESRLRRTVNAYGS